MKARYILLVIILLVAVVYLWSEQKQAQESLEIAYAQQRFQDFEHIAIIMSNSMPNTLNLYNNNFTEKELSLFKHSLTNAIFALDLKRAKIKKIEHWYGNNYNLSESVEEFQYLMFEIRENAGTIDEEIFYQMSKLINGYSKKMMENNFRAESVQGFFDQSTKLFNEMNQEINDLVKLPAVTK